ncbi:MAG: DUF4263 domain-containing protein [Bacteroidales bacterium]|jgi:hypothetical protein|nr:DUF4263 domain-containing protein [Chitinophagaceae bacterium]MBK8930240.1 DUF4263 domain-containing protein [Chitinophagaceae bacterium]MBP8994035.1 DUF4263 domain-containing protein [Bacteroidales bacterium]
MPSQVFSTRNITSGSSVKTYSKSFDMTGTGLQKSADYAANKSKARVSGEKLSCSINKSKKVIKVFTTAEFPIDFFTATGISTLTKLKGTYNTTGSFYKGFGNIILEILKAIPKIVEFTIDFSTDSKTKVTTKAVGKHLILSSHDYNYIHGLFDSEKKQINQSSLSQALKFLSRKITIPANVKIGGELVSTAFKKTIFKEVISNLSDKELHELLFQLYEKRYDILASKIELFKETDTYKLDYINELYQQHLKKHKSHESKWQTFFEDNFNIINPSYKYVIREVDTIIEQIDEEAKSRPIDFIAIDIYNNIELIELKTPSADIISKRKDRNNYCLTHNCTKACTQLEKYLIKIESNKLEVAKLITEKVSKKYGIKKSDLNIFITKPKAKLIIGMIEPLLPNFSRHQDFQLQRHSFKNIEIVTFDEIFNSLDEINKELKRKITRRRSALA